MKHDRDSYSLHARHVAKLAEKHLCYEGKLAILQEWEKRANGDHDHEYLLGLRKRVRSLKVQLDAMLPGPVSRNGSEFE